MGGGTDAKRNGKIITKWGAGSGYGQRQMGRHWEQAGTGFGAKLSNLSPRNNQKV